MYWGQSPAAGAADAGTPVPPMTIDIAAAISAAAFQERMPPTHDHIAA
jgi:hypothetical protein